jgi:hypothetical protein
MPTPSDSEIELRFGREPDRSEFPHFCNSLVALEGPKASSFPVLSTKSGPDGGIDGEWDLSEEETLAPSVVALAGWNIYQFKTLDVTALGETKAFAELCRRAEGAVAEVISRLANDRVPARYVLFTNLRLGLETVSSTNAGKKLNTKRKRVREGLLRDAPHSVDIQIIDAAQIAGILIRHAALSLAWFSSGTGNSWDEMDRQERMIGRIHVPLVGREADLASLRGWLASPEVRVIAVTGPNSIGKTRLALESTRGLAPHTVFAKDSEALLKIKLNNLATSERSVVIVADDPPTELIEALASQALAAVRPLKLLITLPSPAHAPVVRLGDDERIRSLHIAPLNSETARRLIQLVNSNLDQRALDWVVQQAGGVPGVLVDAALAGADLRRDSGTLREQLTRKYRQRLESRAGLGAVPIAQALCLLVYVWLRPSQGELTAILSEIASDIPEATVLREVSRLEELGYVRRRGEYVAVIPPLFAAGLAHQLVSSQPMLPERLFSRLDLAARKRLIERLVTLELSDSIPFWSFIFGPEGPFGEAARFAKNFDLLDCLARATPRATALFLQQRFDFILREVLPLTDRSSGRLRGAIYELLDEPEAAGIAFALTTDLACRDALESEERHVGAHFLECFVFWYPRPVSFRAREAALDRLLAADEPALRELAVKAIITATNPPHSLSGRGVVARRLGPQPQYGTMRECYDFLLRMMRRRLALCTGADSRLSELASNELAAALGEFCRSLPIEDAMEILREVTELHFSHAVPFDLNDLYGSIRWIRDFYARSREKPEQAEWNEQWTKVIDELDALMARLNAGSFASRLRIAIGRTFDYDKVIHEGHELYQYQVQIRRLAVEASGKPDVMDEAAWSVLEGKDMPNAAEFVLYLGECDRPRFHFAWLRQRAHDWRSSAFLAEYLRGAAQSSPAWVETKLDEIMTGPGLSALLSIRAVGPSPANRNRLRNLISKRVVTPNEVASAFSFGRWLDGLPPNEVLTVLEFITSELGHEGEMLEVVSLYLHKDRALPRELFDVVRRSLAVPCGAHSHNAYNYDQAATGLARTDAEAGFTLLAEIIEKLSDLEAYDWRTGWNPFASPGSHDFWEYLRGQSPERAYRSFGRWRRASRWPDLRGHDDGRLLDLEAHHALLIGIARTEPNSARVFADSIKVTHPGFFIFAYALIEAYPDDAAVWRALNSGIIEQTGFGTEYDHVSSAGEIVRHQLASEGLSPEACRWLEALSEDIRRRKTESHHYLGSSEPIFWE